MTITEQIEEIRERVSRSKCLYHVGHEKCKDCQADLVAESAIATLERVQKLGGLENVEEAFVELAYYRSRFLVGDFIFSYYEKSTIDKILSKVSEQEKTKQP